MFDAYENEKFWLVDLDNVTKTCQLPDYPIFTKMGPGAIVYDKENGTVRSCSGWLDTKTGGYTNRCFVFNGFEWREMESRSSEVLSSLSSYVPGHGWWLFDCSYPSGCALGQTHSEIYL